MDQHPIPRQITTFEFKLIGFMTLRQFIYLIIFIPLGFVAYFLFPIPLLNVFLGIIIGCAGIFFAFFPVNDRPLDVWIKNMFKRLTKPTQYFFFKKNTPIYYLENLFFVSDPHRTATHIESQEKLTAYLAQTKKTATQTNQTDKRKQIIGALLQKLPALTKSKSTAQPTIKQVSKNATRKTFFTGIIKNHKLIVLPGILVYVKGQDNKTLRLLKTNPHGVFATFNPLPAGEYFFEFRDPNNNYFFDKMKIKTPAINERPIEVFSKELI